MKGLNWATAQARCSFTEIGNTEQTSTSLPSADNTSSSHKHLCAFSPCAGHNDSDNHGRDDYAILKWRE